MPLFCRCSNGACVDPSARSRFFRPVSTRLAWRFLPQRSHVGGAKFCLLPVRCEMSRHRLPREMRWQHMPPFLVDGGCISCSRPTPPSLRFPSSCPTVRPHLLHCILAASHAWDRGMYDEIRRVYNSIGHVGCRPAPAFEEWSGMRQLCDHIFCRCVCPKYVPPVGVHPPILFGPTANSDRGCCHLSTGIRDSHPRLSHTISLGDGHLMK